MSAGKSGIRNRVGISGGDESSLPNERSRLIDLQEQPAVLVGPGAGV